MVARALDPDVASAEWAGREDRAERLGRALAPLLVVAVALLAAEPLFRGGMVPGHDAHEHVTRTAEYARALASGVWWPQWSPNLGHGYGEPIFLFNPPLFYILGAVPAVAGLPVVWAVNLATALLLVVGGLGVYAWMAPIVGRPPAVVAAAAYVWAPYVLLDLYVRQALTELTAVCLLPWALWGLARACRTPGRRSVALGGLVVALLLLSSTPGSVTAAPALLGQVVVLADRRRPRAVGAMLAALALGALLASAFWVPVLADRHLLRFDRALGGKLTPAENFLQPWQLVSSAWDYGYAGRDLDPRRMGFGLGEAHLALGAVGVGLLVPGVVGRRGRPSVRRYHRRVLFALGLVGVGAGLSLGTSAFIWDLVPTLQYVQFPWRFLMLAALGCAVLAALPAALLGRGRPRAAPILAVACVGLVVAAGWARGRPRDLLPYTDARFAPELVASRDRARGTVREYETVWTVRRPGESPSARLVVTGGSAAIADLGGTAHEQRFGLAVETPSRLRLNTFYFPGWRVLVDGRERAVDYRNPNGLIELLVEPGESSLVARFEPTPARWIGRALSLGGLVLVVGLLIARPSRRRAVGVE